MLYFRGMRRNIENIMLFSQRQLPVDRVRSRSELKRAYNKHLATIQPEFTTTTGEEVEIVRDIDIAEKLVHLYKDVTDIVPVTDEIIRIAKEKSDSNKLNFQSMMVLDSIGRIRNGNPRLGHLLDLSINRVFVFDIETTGGGSNSRGIGVIWANPIMSWNTHDMVEFFIHELTHNLLFIEEIVHPLYRSVVALEDKKTFATSAILKIPRRLDLVVHSLVVGMEILLSRENWLGHTTKSATHPSSTNLIRSCRDSISSIQSIPDWQELFLPNGLAILEDSIRELDRIAAKLPEL